MKNPARLFVILILLNLIWAPTLYMAKVAQNTFTPLGLVSVRWTLFALLLGSLVVFRGIRDRWSIRLPEPKDRLKAFLIGAFCASSAHTLYYFGLARSSSIETNVLNTLLPVFTGVLAFFVLRERVSSRRWAAIIVGGIGAYIVAVGFGVPNMSSGHALGNLMFLGGVFMECLAMVLATRLILRSSGIGVLTFEAIGVMVGTVSLVVLTGDSMRVPGGQADLWTALVLFYLAAVAGVFAFGAWYVLVEGAPVSLMMISCLIQPPLAAFLGRFLGEVVTPQTLWGSLVIAFSLVIAASERTSKTSLEEVTDGQACQNGDRNDDHGNGRENGPFAEVAVREES